mmetsp:Transcript_49349/g.158827  ORF Transcript_49349/g.158827 Transcript_49349/m.158827 type:complete len:236 (-) Transcript_49349:2248-2955(-)
MRVARLQHGNHDPLEAAGRLRLDVLNQVTVVQALVCVPDLPPLLHRGADDNAHQLVLCSAQADHGTVQGLGAALGPAQCLRDEDLFVAGGGLTLDVVDESPSVLLLVQVVDVLVQILGHRADQARERELVSAPALHRIVQSLNVPLHGHVQKREHRLLPIVGEAKEGAVLSTLGLYLRPQVTAVDLMEDLGAPLDGHARERDEDVLERVHVGECVPATLRPIERLEVDIVLTVAA